jgi:tetratricopeptide (TPR) repeat protein
VLLAQTNRPDEAAGVSNLIEPRAPDRRGSLPARHRAAPARGHGRAIAEFRETIRIQPAPPRPTSAWARPCGAGEPEATPPARSRKAERLNRKKVDRQAAIFAIDLGKRRLAGGDAAGGVASLREAVRLAPDMAEAQLQLALALEKQGQKAEARKHFDEARRLAPHLQAQPRAAARSEPAAPPVPQP